MYDLTHENQLASVPGSIAVLDVSAYEPYANDLGVLLNPTGPIAASGYRGYSSADWEPYVYPSSTAGTVEVISGAVELTGATFPSYTTDPYPGWFYINGEFYQIAAKPDSTHITLVDASVNAAAGSSYKVARFGFREVDPKFAAPGEMEIALDELAYALSLYDSAAISNGARIGLYELIVHIYRRPLDIIDDFDTGAYEQWQDDVATTANYVTASGFSIAEYIRRRSGKIYWSNYVTDGFAASPHEQGRWLRRNQRIMETLDELNIPNAPLFMRHTQEGFTDFVGTGTGATVPDAFQMEMLEAVQAFQPHQWAFWGVVGQYDAAYVEFIADYAATLPWSGSPLGTSISSTFSSHSLQLAMLGP